MSCLVLMYMFLISIVRQVLQQFELAIQKKNKEKVIQLFVNLNFNVLRSNEPLWKINLYDTLKSFFAY